MLSISILAYSYTPMEEGYVLNSKKFSPCAIIATFEAAEPDEYAAGPVSFELSEEQMSRKDSISIMGYDGNRLLRELPLRIKSKARTKDVKQFKDVDIPPLQAGQRVSFKKV